MFDSVLSFYLSNSLTSHAYQIIKKQKRFTQAAQSL
jgi:hypothetical protein